MAKIGQNDYRIGARERLEEASLSMAKISKERLKAILTDHLRLREPEFHLEKAGSRLIGNVISPTFKGKRDHERQKMIWDALEAELSTDAILGVGMILAYTPDEWTLGAESVAKPKKAG